LADGADSVSDTTLPEQAVAIRPTAVDAFRLERVADLPECALTVETTAALAFGRVALRNAKARIGLNIAKLLLDAQTVCAAVVVREASGLWLAATGSVADVAPACTVVGAEALTAGNVTSAPIELALNLAVFIALAALELGPARTSTEERKHTETANLDKRARDERSNTGLSFLPHWRHLSFSA
jgi:hypothetical protein